MELYEYTVHELMDKLEKKEIKLSGADSPYKVNNWAAGSVYKYYITVSDEKISLSVIRVIDWIDDDVILEE